MHAWYCLPAWRYAVAISVACICPLLQPSVPSIKHNQRHTTCVTKCVRRTCPFMQLVVKLATLINLTGSPTLQTAPGPNGASRAFDSNYNALAPVRATLLQGWAVRAIACGGAHTLILATSNSNNSDHNGSSSSNSTHTADKDTDTSPHHLKISAAQTHRQQR